MRNPSFSFFGIADCLETFAQYDENFENDREETKRKRSYEWRIDF